jgi:hypothetical protein
MRKLTFKTLHDVYNKSNAKKLDMLLRNSKSYQYNWVKSQNSAEFCYADIIDPQLVFPYFLQIARRQ